jgi:hypothetical protein
MEITRAPLVAPVYVEMLPLYPETGEPKGCAVLRKVRRIKIADTTHRTEFFRLPQVALLERQQRPQRDGQFPNVFVQYAFDVHV